jgi:deoxyribonuclease-4
LRIGAHLPVADGYPATLAYALELGCEAVQVFAKSPRMWSAPPVDADAATSFSAARAEAGIGPCVTHAAYLINLGSTDQSMWEKSVLAMTDELRRAAALAADGVVVHMGTAPEGPDAAAIRVAEGVRRAWMTASSALGTDAPWVLLENSAGAGHSFGRDVAEVAATVAAVRASGVEAVGACIDTCHAFAAGIDLRDADGWDALSREFDERVGLDRLRVIHANDCAGGLGERRDRHAWIGDGEIGERGFAAMFEQTRLAHVAAIIEMPGERPVKDVENLARLRRLRASVSAP